MNTLAGGCQCRGIGEGRREDVGATLDGREALIPSSGLCPNHADGMSAFTRLGANS